MRIQSKGSSHYLKILPPLLIIIAIIVGAIAFNYRHREASTTLPNPGAATSTQADTDRLKTSPAYSDPAAQQEGVNVPTSPESAGTYAFPTTQPNLTVAIKSIVRDGSVVIVDADIQPPTEGTCILELTKTGHSAITKTVPLSGTRCSDSSLQTGAQTGLWSLTVKVFSGNNVATATKDVSL